MDFYLSFGKGCVITSVHLCSQCDVNSNRPRQQESIHRASSLWSPVDGSISCISLCVQGGRVGGGGYLPSDLSLLVCSAEWADTGARPSSITGHGTYIVFHGLLGRVYDQQDPDTVCLWRDTSYSGPAASPHPSCPHPSIHFPASASASHSSPHLLINFSPCPPQPSFCCSIRLCLSASPPLPPHLRLPSQSLLRRFI